MRLGGSEDFVRIGRSGNLGAREVRKDRQDVLAGYKCIFATSCSLCVIFPVITAQKNLSTAILLLFMLLKYIFI
jgi:hypothetical protein